MNTEKRVFTYITEDQLDMKYADGFPWYRKNPIERFICNKHGERTILLRDNNVCVHVDIDTQCG